MICNPAGISYFNSKASIGNQYVFLDNKGNGYDGYVSGIATKDNNIFYIGTDENLIKWNRSTNTTAFCDIKDETKQSIFRDKEVTSVLVDNNDHVWATTVDNGIVVTDKNLKLIRHIKNSGNDDPYVLKIKNLRRIALSPSGDVWASGNF